MNILQKIKERLVEWLEKRHNSSTMYSSMIIENWDLLSREEYETLSPEEIERREEEKIKMLRQKIEEIRIKDELYEQQKKEREEEEKSYNWLEKLLHKKLH